MSPQVLIRDATPEDAAALARVHEVSRVTAMPWLAKVHSEAETVAWMADKVIPLQRVRVAVVAGVPVALAAFAEGWLHQLYVLPGHQNAGIGSHLFKDVCAAAAAPFQLWVFQRNEAARRFYERHGCRLIRLTDGRANEEREPDALYEKPFGASVAT